MSTDRCGTSGAISTGGNYLAAGTWKHRNILAQLFCCGLVAACVHYVLSPQQIVIKAPLQPERVKEGNR